MPEPAIGAFETERLALRLATPANASDLLALDGDPAVMQFINGGRPSTPTEVAERLAAGAGHLWVARGHSGEFIGWFTVRPTGATQRELGYRLLRAQWGQGYATEGSLALLAIAFDQLGTTRVWAQTMTVNTRSRGVMERCGMRYMRTFHLDWDDQIKGTAEGDVEYEILSGERLPLSLPARLRSTTRDASGVHENRGV